MPTSATPPKDAPGSVFEGWTPADVEGHSTRLLGKQGPFRATVRLLEIDGTRYVAKDYRACTALYRWTAGAWNLRREMQALARLRGLAGIPAVEARIGRWILVLTWFGGKDLGKTPRADQTDAFFGEMDALVRAMHERGVVHLDLRQRRNVLVQRGPHPAIIDFGASLCVRPGGFLLRLLAPVDTSGVLKYKRRASPDSLTESEAHALRKLERRRRWWPFS